MASAGSLSRSAPGRLPRAGDRDLHRRRRAPRRPSLAGWAASTRSAQDLVAMCADDVVCTAPSRCVFLDYSRWASSIPQRVAPARGLGIADACAQSAARWSAARRPSIRAHGGRRFRPRRLLRRLRRARRLIDGTAARAGDVMVGMATSGLHSNGFSLVRTLVADGSTSEASRRSSADARAGRRRAWPPSRGALTSPKSADADASTLLPSSGFGPPARPGATARPGPHHRWRAPGNMPRAVGDGPGHGRSAGSWPVPAIFDCWRPPRHSTDADMRATFNCGIGLARSSSRRRRPSRSTPLRSHGIDAAWVIGTVDAGHRRRHALPRGVSGRVAVCVSGAGTNLRALRELERRGLAGRRDRARPRRPPVPCARLRRRAGYPDRADRPEHPVRPRRLGPAVADALATRRSTAWSWPASCACSARSCWSSSAAAS